MPKKKPQKLHVMFDTNVLFTKVASDLVRHDVKRIITENSNHPDLTIEWHLPEVVIGERKFQMLSKAKDLLPSIQKLEKLLGHKLGVGEDTLELHVDKAINNSMEECCFHKATIDTNRIDWEDLISLSVRREPPFEVNEKEKGFRDAIIAHSFIHLLEKSPSTPNICRLALISEDQRLKDYVVKLTSESKNVRILSSLEELESLINTLVSTIPEEFAMELASKASKLFFEKGNDKSFYFKENIGEKIQKKFSKELSETIIQGHRRNDSTWWVMNPIFIKKNRQRIHWVTMVEPEFQIYHYEYEEAPTPPQLGLPGLSGLPSTSTGIVFGETSGFSPPWLISGETSGVFPSPPPPPSSTGLFGLGDLGQRFTTQKKVVDLTGRDKIEIHWSTNLTQAQNLTAPKLEGMKYMGNNLSDGSS